MVLFLLFGQAPLLLVLTLLGALYLTFLELRPLRLTRIQRLWWLLLVVLTHVFGYLALRLWLGWRARGDGASS